VAASLHPRRAGTVASVVGIAAAVGLVAAGYLTGPSVLVPSGTAWTVPAYVNGTAAEGGPVLCQEHHDCGHAGLLAVGFRLAGPARLTGTLASQGPLVLAIANPAGLGVVQCGLYVPPSNCTFMEGAVSYTSPSWRGTVDLSTLEFGLSGANNVVPSGTWTLCLINWGNASVAVSVGPAVTQSPT